MWRPQEVVREHRCRATALWLFLMVSIIGYSIFLVRTAVQKSRNPSTSYVLSNELYSFPDVYVCLYNFLGCDKMEWEERCRDSAFGVDRETTATFNPGGDDEQEIGIGASFLDTRGHCVRFNLSDVEFSTSQRNPEDYVLIDMYWYPGRTANGSLTCGAEAGAWQAHSESVSVFFRDPETRDLSAGSQVPYNCITNTSDRHFFNFMGIGLTREVPLYGQGRSSYKALTIITSIHKEPTWENVTAPFAYLSMEVAQSVDSFEVITEINPWEIAEFFGNVGGFWDLILFLWPLFFVSASRTEPTLKSRNFKKSLQKSLKGADTKGLEDFSSARRRSGRVAHSSREMSCHGPRPSLSASRRIPMVVDKPTQRNQSWSSGGKPLATVALHERETSSMVNRAVSAIAFRNDSDKHGVVAL